MTILWTTLTLFGLQYYGHNIDDDDNRAEAALLVKSFPKATIAYAVSLTSCGRIRNGGGHSSDPSFHEGAAVLKHSIHLASIRNYHHSKSLFDYEVMALHFQ